MLIGALFVATAILYALACGLFIAFLAKGNDRVERAATGALVAAVACHLGFWLGDYLTAGNLPAVDIHGTLAVLSLAIVVAFLLALLKYRVTVLGAFLTPVTLLFFMGAGLGRSVAHVPGDVRSALLPVHIGVNILGIVAFALAFAAAVAYVLQDRALRRKQFGGVFQRLPPLDVLDSMGFRLVITGFPLLTLGIVTGTMWAAQTDAPTITASQSFALVAWVMFAGVLLLRVAAGWRGRRAAIGTIMGFLSATVVLLGYVVRGGT